MSPTSITANVPSDILSIPHDQLPSLLVKAASVLHDLNSAEIKQLHKYRFSQERQVFSSIFELSLSEGVLDPFRPHSLLQYDNYSPDIIAPYLHVDESRTEESRIAPFGIYPDAKEIAESIVNGTVSPLSLMAIFRDTAYKYARAEDHSDLFERAAREPSGAVRSIADIISKDGEEPVLVELQSNPFFKQASVQMEAELREQHWTEYGIDVFIAGSAYVKAIERGVSDISAAVLAVSVMEKYLIYKEALSGNIIGDNKLGLGEPGAGGGLGGESGSPGGPPNESSNGVIFHGNTVNLNTKNVISSQTVILNSAALIAQIQVYKNEARQSNRLGEKKDDLLDFLDRLKASIEELIIAVPEADGTQNSTAVNSWREQYWDSLSREFSLYLDPINAGKGTAPTALILSAGALGSAIGAIGGGFLGLLGYGAAGGFTAGALAGKIFTGSAKGDEAAKKVEKTIFAGNENEPEEDSR